MAHWYKFALYYLWVAPHALLVVVPVLMYARRIHKDFPVFFVYTLFETFEFVVLFAAYMSGRDTGAFYRYAFIATLAGSTALRFGIIQEIVNSVFHGYSRLAAIANTSMLWVTGLLVVAAILLAVFSPGTVSDSMLAGVALLNRSVVVIQAGVLLFLFLFSRIVGLSWRSYPFGIAFGFAIFASTELAVSALHMTTLTEQSRSLLDLLPTGSYHVSVLVWLGYLLAAEKTVGAAIYPISEIEQWSGELERSR